MPLTDAGNRCGTPIEGGSVVTIDRPWTYEPGSGHIEGQAVTGFAVQATVGIVGQVDRQADEPGLRHLIVETGVWVFGRSVLIPAGIVTGIDTRARQITLACSKEEVKAAPPLPHRPGDAGSRVPRQGRGVLPQPAAEERLVTACTRFATTAVPAQPTGGAVRLPWCTP
jgi:hypothetical protein